MNAATLVLVVAPDKEFRHSLEFALEAEGFTIDPHASTSEAFASPPAQEAGCAVIDDSAIRNWLVAEQEFRNFGRPVVLLAGRIRAIPILPFTTVLTKPFLGTPLIETVREIVARGV